MATEVTYTVTTDDGVRIAVHHLGGSGPPLLMVHATGLCGQVFEPVARLLGERFGCVASDQRGHGQSGRPAGGDYSWSGFALDVLAVVDGLKLEGPKLEGTVLERPVALGHSSGATALVLAELARPGTFGGLWCYEPALFGVHDNARLADQARGLAAGARRRREVFGSRRDARERWAAKAPFSSFAPAALDAYVDGGLEDLPDGRVRLRCRPEDEARIYEAGAGHDAWDRLGQVTCPTTVAWGELSTTFGPEQAQAVASRLPHGGVEAMAGLGHFGPLEDPALVAEALARDLGRHVGRDLGGVERR